jgi:hypothetical protein
MLYRHLCFQRRFIPLVRFPLIGLIALFVYLLLVTPALSQPDVEGSPDANNQTGPSHKKASRHIQLSANWLDGFFDDERIEAEENKTRLRVKLASFIEDGEDLDNSMRFNLRLVLPRLSKKFKKVYLTFSGDGDDDNDLGDADNLRLDYEDGDNENADIGLHYVLKDSIRRNMSIKAGVRLGGGGQLYIGPRYRSLVNFEKWALRLTSRILYFTDDGFESKSRIDFERPITKRLFIRPSTDVRWYEDRAGIRYNCRLFLFHVISPKRVIRYEWRASYETKPHHQLQEVVLNLRYRQPFLKKWLFLDLIPMATFPREKDFDFTPGFMVRFEFIFGHLRKRLHKIL